MRHLLAIQLLAIAVACRAPAADPAADRAPVVPAPAGTLARRAPGAVPAAAPRPPRRARMRAHFYELHTIEAALLRADLDAVRERASGIRFDGIDGQDPAWAPHIERLRAAATALARVESIDDACRIQAGMLGDCARCHEATSTKLSFPAPEAPPDEPSLVARMARHRWAADRAWEGLVGLSTSTWSAGLRAMAAAPLPGSDMSEDPAQWERLARYGKELQRAARRAEGARTIPDRVQAYGALLVVCTGCHAKLESEW